ncbi:hypothetical protein BDR22DRAFT_55655 [Usnea florida]
MSTNVEVASHPRPLLTIAIATSAITMCLMTFAVFARITAKAFVVKKIHLEDYALIFALIGVAAWTSLYLSARAYGLGLHIEDVPAEDLSRFLYLCNIAEIIYGPVIFAAKWSVLLQLKRIFTPAKRDGVYWTINIVTFMTFAFYLATMFSFIFQCSPREAIWNLEVKGKCINSIAATFSCGVINLFSDTATLALPLWAIWHLQMPIKKKLPVSAVFGTGFFACVMGSMGVAYRARLLHSVDFSYIITQVGMWTLAEFCAVIVVSCMPSIPQFFRFVNGKTQPPKTRPYSNTANNSKRPLASSSKGSAKITYVGPERAKDEVSGQYLQLEEY